MERLHGFAHLLAVFQHDSDVVHDVEAGFLAVCLYALDDFACHALAHEFRCQRDVKGYRQGTFAHDAPSRKVARQHLNVVALDFGVAVGEREQQFALCFET